jgi:hypothetical protein
MPTSTPTPRLSGALTSLAVTLVVGLAVMGASTVALAQAGKPADKPADKEKAPAEKTAAAPSPPPGPPQPPPELDQLKWMEGIWRCEGKAPAGPMGPERGYKAAMKIKRELDGFWYAGEYEQKKSKENPMAIKARSFLGYDPVTKKVVSVGVDNVGGALQQTGTLEPDKVSTTGEGSMGGQKVGFREVITKTGDRSLTWHGEVRMGKDWIVIGDDSCKR